MIRYYKLFDLLNRKGMKKSDLRKILSPKTVAKLSKGEYISLEAIEKICEFIHCQPGDIMEYIVYKQYDDGTTVEIVPMLNKQDYFASYPTKEEHLHETRSLRLDDEYEHRMKTPTFEYDDEGFFNEEGKKIK